MQLLLKNLRHYLAGGGVASAAVTPSLLLRLAFRFRDAVVVPRGAFEHDPFLVGSPRFNGQAIEEFSRGIGPRVAHAAGAQFCRFKKLQVTAVPPSAEFL